MKDIGVDSLLSCEVAKACDDYLSLLNVSIDTINIKSLDKDSLIKNYSLISKKELTLISVFYNEQSNVMPFYLECRRLNRIFNIKNFIFVQNGSTDNTEKLLDKLSELDSRVKIVTIENNQGYGYGFKQGLAASKTDLVLLNHSDCQFDAYAYFTQHFPLVMSFDPEVDLLIPVRRGRTFYPKIRSIALRCLASIILRQAVVEFNGQPKIFLKSKIKNLDLLPNDFCFDAAVIHQLLKQYKRRFFLDSVELPRFDGVSSWSRLLSGQVKLTWSYIFGILKLKRCRF